MRQSKGNLNFQNTVMVNFKQVLNPRTHKTQQDKGIPEKYSEQ